MRKKKPDWQTKKFLISVFVAFGLLMTSSFVFDFSNETSVPHQNLVDTKIAQYSDKNITQNAVKTDPQFKSIAFDVPAFESKPFANQMAAVIRTFKKVLSNAGEDGNQTREYGSWLWTPVPDMTPEYIDTILSQAKKHGINTIYVSIDSYLDVFAMPKGTEREEKRQAFGDKLDNFISRANQKGISVDAEAGWRNWAEGENVYKAFAVINYVKSFNATHQNKFRGFQYDVEPYLLDEYKKDPEPVLKNFVKLVDQTAQFLGDDSLRFSVVVPDFYDEKDELTPKFSYNGFKTFAFEHLLNILDRRPNSSIIVMSYRSFASGYDGSIEVSANEMDTAQKGAYATKIIIAQETGDVPPPYITFHNTSKEYLFKQIERIDSAFGQHANFGGFAIHYANAFLALK